MADHAHLLTEIKDNIRGKDPIKARLVLGYLENMDKSIREQVLGAFREAAPEFAVPVLCRFISEHRDMVANLPLVREILAVKMLAQPQLLAKAISDPQTPCRDMYISMAGELRLEEVVDNLIEALLAATDVGEINQILDTLGEIGDPQATNAVSEFLYSGNQIGRASCRERV